MSELTNSLSRISLWLESNKPQLSDSFMPGITLQQIDQITSGLPFNLSEEVICLYQWHNGIKQDSDPSFKYSGFGGLLFYSLEIAIQRYNGLYMRLKREGLWRDEWFPLFLRDPRTYFVVGDERRLLSSPIYIFNSKEYEYSRFSQKYDSLTSMMQTFADCHEMNGFEWASDQKFHLNVEIIEQCYQRYNPVSLSMQPIDEWDPFPR